MPPIRLPAANGIPEVDSLRCHQCEGSGKFAYAPRVNCSACGGEGYDSKEYSSRCFVCDGNGVRVAKKAPTYVGLFTSHGAHFASGRRNDERETAVFARLIIPRAHVSDYQELIEMLARMRRVRFLVPDSSKGEPGFLRVPREMSGIACACLVAYSTALDLPSGVSNEEAQLHLLAVGIDVSRSTRQNECHFRWFWHIAQTGSMWCLQWQWEGRWPHRS